MPTFQCHGPFNVPTYNGKAAKIVDSEQLPEFWHATGGIAEKRGCYVFAVRAGKGFRPIYVGKAAKTLAQEVFATHKLEKYQRALADIRKGTPVIFFLVLPVARGKPNARAIGDLEDYLIQIGVSKNPDLLNVKGTEQANWGISGVIRGGKGSASASAKALKRLFDL